MAYKIQYSPEKNKNYPQNKRNTKHSYTQLFVAALIIMAVIWVRVNGVPDCLVPGDPVVTRAATATMLNELRAGEPLNNAVTVFCKEILYGAGIQN